MIYKTKSLTLGNLLQENHLSILLVWKSQSNIQNVLNSKQINIDFFIKHFGARVLNYFISVLRGENLAGQCPVIMVMLKFFDNHGMKLEEVFRICTGMRNAIIHSILDNGFAYPDEKFAIVTELFDINFSGVIREYIEIHHKRESHERVSYCHSSTPVSESLLLKNNHATVVDNSLLEEYFANDEVHADKVLFRTDDIDDLVEYFNEVPERLSFAMVNSDFTEIKNVGNIFSKVSSILFHYTPYLDPLAASMSELSTGLQEHSEVFMEVLKNSNDALLKLFDAVSIDMDRYVERFALESMAMKNTHHIHNPTTQSIRQIIAMFAPDQIVEGEMEFWEK